MHGLSNRNFFSHRSGNQKVQKPKIKVLAGFSHWRGLSNCLADGCVVLTWSFLWGERERQRDRETKRDTERDTQRETQRARERERALSTSPYKTKSLDYSPTLMILFNINYALNPMSKYIEGYGFNIWISRGHHLTLSFKPDYPKFM